MEPRESPRGGRWTWNVVVVALIALVLVGARISWRTPRAPVESIATPIGSATAGPSAPSNAGSTPSSTAPSPDYKIGLVRDGAQLADLEVFRQSSGGPVCIWLASEGVLSCHFLPRPGESIRLAYAHWLYWGVECCGIGMFVVGAVSSQVDAVRVALGAGRWVGATIVNLPRALGLPFRLFYVERKTGMESLNHRLAVIAFDHGREVGRTSYLVLGG